MTRTSPNAQGASTLGFSHVQSRPEHLLDIERISKPPSQSMSTPPWNDWYHVMCHTYGTWLPGDPRGFRTRHHREHCEGDYKSPPALGIWERRHAHAQQLMKRPPVYLTPEQRTRAVDEIWRSLTERSIDVIIVAIDCVHLHLLARFPDHNPRHWVGVAKRECSHYMKEASQAPIGGLWAVRTQCKPIAERAHQPRTMRGRVPRSRYFR